MIDALRLIAEKRISEAMEDGFFKVEGWKNRPLPLTDDRHIPPELRMAYKILKNSGYLPPEVETRKEISRLEELLSRTSDERTRLGQMKKLDALIFKLNSSSVSPRNLQIQEDYYNRVVERLSVADSDKSGDAR